MDTQSTNQKLLSNGNRELLSDHRNNNPSICEHPVGMQISTTQGGYDVTKQAVRNSLTYGVSCLDEDQVEEGKCDDYKVRYCCMHAGLFVFIKYINILITFLYALNIL